MIRKTRAAISLLLLAGITTLTGCLGASGHYDYEFEKTDAVGDWEAAGANAVLTIDVRDDGTFSATGWPRGLYCDGAIPTPEDNLDQLWNHTVDYSGTWKMRGRDATYTIWFVSTASECASNWGAVAWVVGEGPTSLRIDLSPLTPSEETTESQFVDLIKDAGS